MVHILSAYAGVEKLAESDKFNIYVDRHKKKYICMHEVKIIMGATRLEVTHATNAYRSEVEMAKKLIEMAFLLTHSRRRNDARDKGRGQDGKQCGREEKN